MDGYNCVYAYLSESQRVAFCNAPRDRENPCGGYINIGPYLRYVESCKDVEDTKQKRKRDSTEDNEPRKKSKT